ncbi:16S rRNA (uracil(1498)-N(3))-methyltransferase [Stappia taiwanensis]|uniref:Ribosomal RNA small subunit methyltransferase E n=1 Tax=Stappia taiwanensis TaxID=992267 RepID=A0A838XZC1_9HYPH|nr:16S rRNA (uracil(1498)-N(3))-methyltransferase [Stappia taiwanensis]MBA4612100.1 16S rRNA (uracil(1498)-N(3))-methyltransferase [Stappia taiwanensis]
MPRYEFRMQRLFLPADLRAGEPVSADRAQANYLLNVLRLKDGDQVLVFNGRDGEWRAALSVEGRKQLSLVPVDQTRPQTPVPDLHYLFAPIKHARLDYMVQKAVEMGAGTLRPVVTRHTQSSRVNLERMRSNVIEACEQCGVIAVPEVCEPEPLARVLERWAEAGDGRRLVFCDEGEATQNPLPALKNLAPGPLAVLIGPEGGFSEEERATLRARDFVTPVPLGPRVLRADTAAVAALAVIQAVIGDWH